MLDSWGRVTHTKIISVNLDEKYILWLEKKGKTAGRALKDLIIQQYDQEQIERGKQHDNNKR